MGCDIHLYIEKKVKGKWVAFKEIPRNDYPDDRSYDVFALLAGVRGRHDKTYFRDRGIPEDTSYVEHKEDDDNYCWLGEHSFTYATVHELKKVKWDKYLDWECSFQYFINKYFPLASSSDKNIRILMGFDS